jgi:glucose/arabinose dehydrogenase
VPALALALAASPAVTAQDAAERPRLEHVVGGLREPVLAVPAPDGPGGRLYIVERAGRVRIVDGRRIQRRPFLDLRSRVRSDGFRGLYSLAFHPRHASNGRVFVNYVGRDGDLHLDELRTRGGLALPASRRTMLRIPVERKDANHYGGQLAFGPDGRLYLSVGDGSTPATAQDPVSRLGKLLRLDVDRPGATWEVVALGLRNPWRYSFDPATGSLFVGDAGDERREEVNRLSLRRSGPANFGWDVFEGTLRRRETPAELAGPLVAPFLEYVNRAGRCNSVVGGYVYRGRDVSRLRGRYVYGDFCGGIWSVGIERGRAVGRRSEPIAPGREPFASFGLDARGELLLVTLPGNVYRVVD